MQENKGKTAKRIRSKEKEGQRKIRSREKKGKAEKGIILIVKREDKEGKEKGIKK